MKETRLPNRIAIAGWMLLLAAAAVRADVVVHLANRQPLLAARGRDGVFHVQPWKDLGFGHYDDMRPPHENTGSTWPDRMYGDGWATCWMLLAWQVGRGRSVLAPPPRGTGLGGSDQGARTD